MKLIYLDNAASTPIEPMVIMEMNEVSKLYANPSSFKNAGRAVRKKLEESRRIIAKFLGAWVEEIIFTSSGSEANNMAIFGLIATADKTKNEILVTPVEHLSILEPLGVISKKGFKIKYLKVNKEGVIDLADLKIKINRNTALVSVMYANNEIGTIQPIRKIAKIINEFKKKKLEIDEKMYPFFHTDACQAAEYLDMNVNNLGVDLMTFNGTKIYGPKGAAVLYKRRNVSLRPMIYGGDQEHGLRAGTENIIAVAGLAKAVSLVNRKLQNKITSKLRDYFLENVAKVISGVRINGPLDNERLANNVNISIPNLSSESLLLELDRYGIYASSGSACTAHSVEPSHVLRAIGVPARFIGGALRFSLGRQTTKRDIEYVLKVLPEVVGELRKRYKKN